MRNTTEAPFSYEKTHSCITVDAATAGKYGPEWVEVKRVKGDRGELVTLRKCIRTAAV